MDSKIIDGTKHAADIRADLKIQLVAKFNQLNFAPHFAVVLVGENPASLVYINHKRNDCKEIGIGFTLVHLTETATQEEVAEAVHKLNCDKSVTGILVQQPLPAHINAHEVVCAVAPEKDVDCLHPTNLGLVAMGQGNLLPCTPAGVVELLKREGIPIEGKNSVILGRSNIVGKPLAFLLLQEDATVTICHSKTQNLMEICRNADILIAAIGRPKFVTAEYIKPGAVVVDVGINPIGGKLYGDVDYDSVSKVASYITPVPGGVGPMTRAVLMQNCVRAVLSSLRV